MKLTQIASLINAKVENLKQDIEIKALKSIESATEQDLTFIKDPKKLTKTKAGAILTPSFIENLDIPQLIVEKPDIAFYKLIEIFYPEERQEGFISERAVIGKNVSIANSAVISEYVVIKDNVKIGKNTVVYPFSYIGENTEIGDNCIIYPSVVIYKDTKIGNNVIIHSGAVIASDGFGYYQEGNQRKKIKHVGKVIIEDDVEIGANTTIDRALVDYTIIKRGTKIDNLVMVGHNCKIGENTVLVSQVGIAGSCNIGNNVILAGQVGVADHITITDNVIVTAKSGVGSSITESGIYGSSINAIEWKKWKRVMSVIYKLPEIIKKFKVE
ncbi:UDP-3-O-(3-hydroxymyristoyl)glucosamine N-acyltransferase [Sulfurihydrogenibium azorense]|jgi:UDP-3-O-[3-hydroxymyristoyl] glucosamine N-acyltransferase|uniref:UDP-3-O-acylglucosamine N-acyltransferase n=1 Tax=Sulfurihydrogenibium azorense (strain DSM 15241 / OCM 825 / Az-Fu1) TaxID=204536 RepID=C1DT70_SULAA|nr:UDP-3-O-(3-hydroxymyristoyl)glucosamine N-acyltransferase [Sulfurihydrogenibium azorense]ACN99151.1 UDP-3-O-(3-hydroxymyristoyl) glucosamine N-acyltransferase [Sulfurihydrogenibium azorense Az-Fu1]MDM7273415.1 UDP-3-O-(3-hydroxymyristoyl)glucosamine N-acyltransferase [Sulfurihydrogenibium azorense]